MTTKSAAGAARNENTMTTQADQTERHERLVHDDSMLVAAKYDSPLGELRLVASESGLRAILWPADRPTDAGDEGRVKLGPNPEGLSTILDQVIVQLDEYFAGTREVFTLPLDPVGTDFQLSVWFGLANIPYGQTTSYGRQAAALGNPKAIRAVASANGKNPISIVLPCHRIIGADGSLTGFAGGLDSKAWLLSHEGQQLML